MEMAEGRRGGQLEAPLVEMLGDRRGDVLGPSTTGTSAARAPASRWQRMAPVTPRIQWYLPLPFCPKRRRSQVYACLSAGQEPGPGDQDPSSGRLPWRQQQNNDQAQSQRGECRVPPWPRRVLAEPSVQQGAARASPGARPSQCSVSTSCSCSFSLFLKRIPRSIGPASFFYMFKVENRES